MTDTLPTSSTATIHSTADGAPSPFDHRSPDHPFGSGPHFRRSAFAGEDRR